MITRGIIFLLLFTCLTCGVSYADPGETDENEGHYDRLTGEYHYHRTVAPSNCKKRTLKPVWVALPRIGPHSVLIQ